MEYDTGFTGVKPESAKQVTFAAKTGQNKLRNLAPGIY
jgi:hypothetical protein